MLYIYTIIAGNVKLTHDVFVLWEVLFCMFCSLQKPELFVPTNTMVDE